MVSGYSYKYPQLNDRDFLYREYIENQKSTTEIAKIIGCKSCNSIRQAILRTDISMRDRSTGFTINNPPIKINKQVIDGCLLGDAHLAKWDRTSDLSTASFQKKNIHYDHILYVIKYFYSTDIAKDRIKKYTGVQQTGKTHSHYHFSTFAEPILNEYYDRWYPESNNYVKVVPRDIEIDETLLLHWFLDDGTCSWRFRDGKLTNQTVLRFCTDCFSYEDQSLLVEKINGKFDIGAKVEKYVKTFRIKVPQSRTNKFFDIIGPPPVKDLAYKWKVK